MSFKEKMQNILDTLEDLLVHISNSDEVKFVVTLFLGSFTTMFGVFMFLSWQGLIVVEGSSPVRDVAFFSFIFSFLGGMWTMIIYDRWKDR